MTASRMGPYEIGRRLGAGGMGEVYRARDTRLGREVALKILPADFARDAARRARFDLEARAASALNHPNIVTVHDIGEEGGVSNIVAELVEGESLRCVGTGLALLRLRISFPLARLRHRYRETSRARAQRGRRQSRIRPREF